MWNLMFLFTGLIFIVLLIVVFSSKQRIKSKENKIFNILSVLNLFGFIIEITLQIMIRNLGTNYFFVDIIAKFYIIYIFVWFTIFSIYTFLISYNEKSKINDNSTSKIFKYACIGIAILGTIAIISMPINIFFENGEMYSYGMSPNFLKIMLGVYVAIWIIRLLINFKVIKEKKYYPIIITILLLFANIIIQTINPTILIATFTMTYTCYILFFTIENPDIQLLNEYQKAQDYSNKINEEKELFILDMVQGIKIPLLKIGNLCTRYRNEEEPQILRDGYLDISNVAKSSMNVINKAFNITNIENYQLKITNNSYSPQEIFIGLSKLFQNKLKHSNKEIEFRVNISEILPSDLYGDVYKIKQIVTILLDNALKYTESGYIELKVSSITKKNICRLMIEVSDSGVGIEQSKIDNILDKDNIIKYEEIDETKENLAFCKIMLNSMSGVLLINSEKKKGTEIKIILDQIINNEDNIGTEEINENIEKYIKKYKVALITTDSKIKNKIKRKLSADKFEIEEMEFVTQCLNKMEKRESYDLIIVDEKLEGVTGLESLEVFKKSEHFSIPIIIIKRDINFLDEKEYLQCGFAGCIDEKADDIENICIYLITNK